MLKWVISKKTKIAKYAKSHITAPFAKAQIHKENGAKMVLQAEKIGPSLNLGEKNS